MCSNFTVDSIDSAYVPSNGKAAAASNAKANPSINLAVKGISAACSGSYKVSPGYIAGELHTKATTNSDHKDQPAVTLSWDIASSYYPPNADNATKTYRIPTGLTTSLCQSNVMVTSLHFTGSISAKLINLFKGMIEDTVTSQLNGLLCPKLKQAVEPLATKAIASADKLLTKYLPRNDDNNTNSTPSTDTHNTSLPDNNNNNNKRVAQRLPRLHSPTLQSTKLVDFQKDTPLLLKVLNQLNHFLACFYAPTNNADNYTKNGVAGKNCQNIITKGLKALVSALLDNDLASEVFIPIPNVLHKIKFEIPEYGQVLLDIRSIDIAGIDQLDHLSLLSPLMNDEESKVSNFHTQIVSGAGLNVTAGVNITVFPIPGGVVKGDALNEFFHVHLNTSSLDALATVSLALDRKRFEDIPMGVVMDSLLPGLFHRPTQNSSAERTCLLESVHSFNLSGLKLHSIIESAALVPRLDNRRLRQFLKQSTLLTKKLEEDLDELVNNVLQLVLVEYQPLLTDAVSGLVENPLTDLINRLIDQNLPSQPTTIDFSFTGSRLVLDAEAEAAQCSSGDEDIDKDHHELVNFTNLSFLGKLNDYINKPSSLDTVNKAIDRWADRVNEDHAPSLAPSRFRWASGLFEMTIPGISLRLLDLRLDNLGKIEHIGKLKMMATANPTF